MKALHIAIEDPQTGAEASVHVIRSYTVDLDAKYSQLRVAGYVSEKALADGKQPIAQRHVVVPGVPDEALPAQWLYERLSQPADDIMRANPVYQPSPFVGAKLIEVVTS